MAPTVQHRLVTITMLDGSTVEGDYRQPPPLADRFAFERRYGKSYAVIFSFFEPVLDEEGKQVLDAAGDPVMRMSRDNPVPQEWEVFLVHCQLHRQGLVEAKFELWSLQLADLEFAEVEPVDPPDQDQLPG